MSHTVLTIYNPNGTFLKRMIPIKIEAGRRCKETGAMTFEVDPSVCSYDYFQRRSLVLAEYHEDGKIPQIVGNTLWFVTERRFSGGYGKPRTLKIYCTDANHLLDTRLVAQFPEEPESEKEAPAQDIILEVLREQLGSSAATGRNLSTYLDIPANTGIGPTLYVNIAWQDVGQVVRNVIESSIQNGTEVMLDIQLVSVEPVRLKVVIGERIGIDRSSTLRITPDNGLLAEWEIVDNWKDEKTYLYAGGEGDDDDRLIVEVSNTSAIAQSPFNRVEGWVENSDADVTEMLETYANGELQKLTNKSKMTGHLVIGGALQWNENIGLGDWVTVEVEDYTFVAIVISYAFVWSSIGPSAYSAQVESL